MKIQLLIIGLLTVICCSTKKDKGTADSQLGQTTLYKNESVRYFSSSIKKDTFKITVTGQSIVTGQFRFQIINNAGQNLLDEVYPTSALIGYGFVKTDSTDTASYMTNVIDGYFGDNNFYKPAIANEDKYLKDYSEKGIWDEIKSDKDAIGFRYVIGKRDGRQIAFSKKQEKVVLYFECCP